MNSHMSYAIAQARVADLARDAHRARHAQALSETEDMNATRALPAGAFTRLRRWIGGTRTAQAVDGRAAA